jgi:hypothetical protein
MPKLESVALSKQALAVCFTRHDRFTVKYANDVYVRVQSFGAGWEMTRLRGDKELSTISAWIVDAPTLDVPYIDTEGDAFACAVLYSMEDARGIGSIRTRSDLADFLADYLDVYGGPSKRIKAIYIHNE